MEAGGRVDEIMCLLAWGERRWERKRDERSKPRKGWFESEDEKALASSLARGARSDISVPLLRP
jgi:hypothetical protein